MYQKQVKKMPPDDQVLDLDYKYNQAYNITIINVQITK